MHGPGDKEDFDLFDLDDVDGDDLEEDDTDFDVGLDEGEDYPST